MRGGKEVVAFLNRIDNNVFKTFKILVVVVLTLESSILYMYYFLYFLFFVHVRMLCILDLLMHAYVSVFIHVIILLV